MAVTLQTNSTGQKYRAPKGTRWRSPQLLRDNKPARPGYPEEVISVPFKVAIPLLVAKLHSEVQEICSDPDDAEEYADVLDVLKGLAASCGQVWPDIATTPFCEEARELAVHVPAHATELLVGRLHRQIEQVALDLDDTGRLSKVLGILRVLACHNEVEWADVEARSGEKSLRLGGFYEHRFWIPVFGKTGPVTGSADREQQHFADMERASHPVPAIMEAALQSIAREYDRVYWNFHQSSCPSPFSNTGSVLVTPVFEAHAFSWDEESGQPYNFKWRDLEICWYKHASRGLSSNIPITPDMASECLSECLEFIRGMEGDIDDDFSQFIDLR